MIIIARQMQDTMNNIKDQFLIRGKSVKARLPDRGGGRDNNFPVQSRGSGTVSRLPFRFLKIKGQDVRRPVSLEKMFVQTLDLRIGNKNDRKAGLRDAQEFKNLLYDPSYFGWAKRNPLLLVCDFDCHCHFSSRGI